jgi:hypothetical protein
MGSARDWISTSFEEDQGNVSNVAGIAFIGFELWTLRGDELTEDEAAKARNSSTSMALPAAAPPSSSPSPATNHAGRHHHPRHR